MKRAGGLFERIATFENLLLASRKALLGRRHRDPGLSFALDLEREVHALLRELREGSYRPGPYRSFEIFEPKRRLISAAPFRDRVVHHAVMNHVAPVLERTFITDTYANLTGRGTGAARRRFGGWARRHRFVLRADIRKFFPSIDHEVLKSLLRRHIKCRRTLELLDRILDGSNPQDPALAYFPGDDLFTPYQRRRGIPIGNLTSQWLGNFYLSPLDHFVKERLRVRAYLRYVDDFALFGDDAGRLHDLRLRIEGFLTGFRLRLHPRKTQVSRTADGPSFLGFRFTPQGERLVKSNVHRFRRRLRHLRRAYACGEADLPAVRASIQGWLGHAREADTARLRAEILRGAVFARGLAS